MLKKKKLGRCFPSFLLFFWISDQKLRIDILKFFIKFFFPRFFLIAFRPIRIDLNDDLRLADNL
ncbi:hypothetical protein THFILI_00005 [Thermus filiformis]|uniref:Uncharacterized protein n=1 Tax=Thermus filiformis TaxID=276 RepID=A0A0D6XAA5_THEFI|nr:hypothetical protein THFILI_00005 [Thermus filiformis]